MLAGALAYLIKERRPLLIADTAGTAALESLAIAQRNFSRSSTGCAFHIASLKSQPITPTTPA